MPEPLIAGTVLTDHLAPRLVRFLKSRQAVSIGLFVGVVALGGAWLLSDTTKGFFAGLLLETGAAFVLLIPLVVLQRSMESRVEETERQTVEIRQEVAQVRTAIAELSPDRISEEVINRLNEKRAEDLSLLAVMQEAPTVDRIARCLWRWHELHYVSSNGLRVPLYDTDLVLRFQVPDAERQAHLRLVVETYDGEPVKPYQWDFGTSPVDFGAEVAEDLQRRSRYPGDAPFQFGRTLATLGENLEMVFTMKSGVTGIAETLWPLIQVFEPQWAITELGLERIRDRVGYQISADRFDEMDWDQHVSGKGWADVGSFRWAFDVARDLRERGEWDGFAWYQQALESRRYDEQMP